jgi:hypothetical protein
MHHDPMGLYDFLQGYVYLFFLTQSWAPQDFFKVTQGVFEKGEERSCRKHAYKV